MSHKEFWISILKRLQPTIKKAHFITWFQDSLILEKTEKTITLGLPTVYARDWIANKYGIKILQAAKEIEPAIENINYQVAARLKDDPNSGAIDVKTLFSVELDKRVRKVRNMNEVSVIGPGGAEKIKSQMLNDRYCLDNFITGIDNRLPLAACQAIARTPGGIYNPLYIYGGSGLGKTHLIQATGNQILNDYPDMVIKYLTAERFVTEVVEAIGKRYMKSFKEQYRNVDCFLIDDIQFFARKNSSQQELFHTFDELYDRNKQIILTSDRPPSELDDLDERLKSRFGMGMVVELILPDYETRLAILHQKCREFQIIIDPEVLAFIANNITSSVRELEGVLRQVLAEGDLFDRVVTIRSVAEIIKRMNKAQRIVGYDFPENANKAPARTFEEVMNIVAEYYRVSVDQLRSDDRHKNIMMPRQVCMYLIKNELGESYEHIGVNFGGRNHTTVMHACSKTAKKLKMDIRLIRDINAIKKEMGL